jgi:hypothetical protein
VGEGELGKIKDERERCAYTPSISIRKRTQFAPYKSDIKRSNNRFDDTWLEQTGGLPIGKAYFVACLEYLAGYRREDDIKMVLIILATAQYNSRPLLGSALVSEREWH